MGEVRKVGNLAFLTKKGLFGVKWHSRGSTKRHKKHKGYVWLWITARADASSKSSHDHRKQIAWQARWAGTVTGRFRCFCSRRPRVFFAVKKGSWRNP